MLTVKGREEREEFLRKLKEEWKLMWMERYDDKLRAEGVAARDYPLLFMDRGFVIFASRDAKTPSFSEIKEFWASQGLVYSPDPAVGGWRKFVKTFIANQQNLRRSKRAQQYVEDKRERQQQLKKGGRGWLHIV
ncbi:hypothetical protein KEJ24_01970 [Candidatus Bathyarchaeota archaeon]|nr:hypothetical protein [Candidatus Bathyarchaeota archaeon]